MPSKIDSFVDSFEQPTVKGKLHSPNNPSGDGVIITHGAGADHDWPLLVALAELLSESGVTVLRCDLPFRQQRPLGPPRGNGEEDRDGLRRAVQLLRQTGLQRIFLGGQSYGGRQASMLVAQEPALADGLLVLSYPLHPPGKPEQLRIKHLSQIQVPSLFVSGSKDSFGSPQELEAAIGLIPARNFFLLIEGAGHDLGYGRRVTKAMQDVPSRIAHAFLKMLVLRKED